MGVDAQMLVRTRQILSPDQVLQLAGDLAEAFGSDHFSIWDDATERAGWSSHHALQIITEYEQDGDSIFPEPGEQFLDVNIATRFYGEGYERGNIGLIKNVAEWLEARIPDARIFYGGDSSGICAEPFDREARQKLWEYYCRVGHRPYHEGFSRVFGADQPVVCSFCKRPMVSYGGGGAHVFLSCDSCGKRVVYNGLTKEAVVVERNEDYFAVSNRMRASNAE